MNPPKTIESDIPMNPLRRFKDLNPGCVYYLDKYYGNVYRKIDDRTAEFVRNRHSSDYVGCRVWVPGYQAVRLQPLTPEEIELLGIDPYAQPFDDRWVMPPGHELLGDPPPPRKRMPAPPVEDLLGEFPQPDSPAPQRLSRAERRAARKARKLAQLHGEDLL